MMVNQVKHVFKSSKEEEYICDAKEALSSHYFNRNVALLLIFGLLLLPHLLPSSEIISLTSRDDIHGKSSILVSLAFCARVRVRKPLCALSSFPYWKSP